LVAEARRVQPDKLQNVAVPSAISSIRCSLTCVEMHQLSHGMAIGTHPSWSRRASAAKHHRRKNLDNPTDGLPVTVSKD
jgi:hypothetical protein